MYLRIHTKPFRLGVKTYYYGVIYRLPFGRYHAWGRPF